MTRDRFHHTLVASWLCLGGCSLQGLEDFGLRPCHSNLDCYVLSEDEPDSLLTCYVCNAGRCEQRGSQVERSFEPPVEDGSCVSDDPDCIDWLRTVDAPDPQQDLVLAGGQRGTWGWKFGSEPSAEEPTQLAYFPNQGSWTGESRCVRRDGSDRCRLVEHAAAWLSARDLLGVSINVGGIEKGEVRVGVAEHAAPFAYRDQLDAGIGDPAVGARNPDIVVARQRDGGGEAVAIWLAAKTGDSPWKQAPIMRMGLGFQTSDVHAAILEVDQAPPEQIATARAPAAPKLVAVGGEEAPGVVLVYVDETGALVMRPLRIFGKPAAKRLVVSTTDPVDSVAVAAGSAKNGEGTLLLAWSEGKGQRVMATRYRWSSRGLRDDSTPIKLREGGKAVRQLAVAFAPEGFALNGASGGWSIVWEEVASESSIIQGTRVPEQGRDAGTYAQQLIVGGLPFVTKGVDGQALFRYGTLRRPPDDVFGIRVLACE